MASKPNITPEHLRQLIRYDADTGKMFWRWRNGDNRQTLSWNNRFAGKEAITANQGNGYLSGNVNNKTYLAHRLAFCIHHGYWPKGHIDHINGQRTDNRISNLRDVSPSQNQKNRKLSCNNKSGVTGVHYDKPSGNWVASINTPNGRSKLGTFAFFEDAVSSRRSAEREFGYHKNHGRISI